MANWAVVTGFYAALHHVEPFLATDKRQASSWNHFVRNKLVERHPALGAAHAHYVSLYTRSRDLRYNGVDVTAAEAEALLATHLAPVLSIATP